MIQVSPRRLPCRRLRSPDSRSFLSCCRSGAEPDRTYGAGPPKPSLPGGAQAPVGLSPTAGRGPSAARRHRCAWASREPLLSYHDLEWGTPVHDDRLLFEFLILESMQAGLSWETVLRKRDAFRHAFVGFDPVKVSAFRSKDVARLMIVESFMQAVGIRNDHERGCYRRAELTRARATRPAR